MAKRTKPTSIHSHRDCVYARDFFDINYLGNPILCRCDYKEFAILLNDPACTTHFKQKRNEKEN